MSRLALAVAAALLLPVVSLAAMVVQQERMRASPTVLSVPLRGYDPRDLLQGHFFFGQLDWDWQGAPTTDREASYRPVEGGLCVVSADRPKPLVRFLPGWKVGDGLDGDCRLALAGRGWPGLNSVPARFVPRGLDNGEGGIKLFVSEARGPELENILRKRPGALTVDLAVRPDGSAAIKALRLDGQPIGR
jgi:hypothetical protein